MPSINSNISAFFAQNNLRAAETKTGRSIAALSSGNRIIRASDDVSGLAIGTVLRTNVSTLKTALNSANQAATLLAIADGSLQNIGSLLERQKALSVSANSGTLTNVERGFLNQEFQALKDQIDQTVGGTKFNSVKLIDGSIFDKTDIGTNLTDTGTSATGSLVFGANVVAGDYITLNGVQINFTATGDGNTVAVGANATASATNLTTFLQNSTDPRLSAATYSRSGTTVTITARQTGTIGNGYTVTENVTAGGFTVSGATLTGGVNGDLEAGTVTRGANDVVGDNIITALSATAAARATATVTAATIVSGNTVTVNGVLFTFGTTPGTVALGASDTAAIHNLAIAIAQNTDSRLSDITATDAAGVLTLSSRSFGTAGNAYTLTSSGATVAVSGATFANGAGSGIQLGGIVNNADFTGTVSGFKATYVSADKVNVEVTVGGQTYTATINDTTPGANQFVHFQSILSGQDGGGSFDVELASGQGLTVNNQANADTYAQRLDAAFSTVKIYQNRDVDSTSYAAVGSIFTGTTQTGTLAGSSVDFKLNDFTKAQISDVKVEAPAAGSTDGKITITLANGETFQTGSGLTNDITDGATVTLTSTTNPNEQILLTLGTLGLTGGDVGDTNDSAVLFESDSQAAAFEGALKQAFGLGVGGGGIQFQVGINATDTIKVAIEGVSTTNLYKDTNGISQALDISTAEGAQQASTILDSAINKLTEVRSGVGALQSRFNFVSATLQSSIQNTDAARSAFLDADIATEATDFASNQVLVQASIAVLAQANQLPQNLLKLIG
jgi:flagellin